MPIKKTIRQTSTDPLIFPLLLNDLPFNMAGVTALALVRSGLDGRLKETRVSGATVSIYAATSGLVKWALTSGDLPAAYGPYRIWFECTVSGGIIAVPQDDHFLVTVLPVTY